MLIFSSISLSAKTPAPKVSSINAFGDPAETMVRMEK